ncbi:PA2778 family cysteine peptidase [Hahella ganghwensis]|uniref:PA2778 family cysteine peptidase n=1 Tax=Hahella ganghwensis TaxID=286420 RepID=UPI0012F760E6|nr:PA2778 family cysteine peptidase [Hahella ganghwensis]
MSILTMLWVSGCALYPQSRALLSSPPSDLPTTHEITDIPFFPQAEYQCGPAALAMMLNHSGISIQPDSLTNRVYVPGRKGSFQLEMTATARSFGRAVYPLRPDIKNILLEVAQGHPVLVLQNLGLSWAPVWHYAVIVGYDLNEAEIWLHSGTDAYVRMNLGTFERSWRYSSPWAVTVLSPTQLPATASALEYVKSLQDLVKTGQLTAANKGYHAAVTRWPDSALVRFGLGNLAYQQKEYDQAAAAFIDLVKQHPDYTRGWNNLSYALASMGCNQALAAVSCTLNLANRAKENNETSEQFQTTSQDVHSILSERNITSAICPQLPTCP